MSIASPTEIPGTVPAARPAGGLASPAPGCEAPAAGIAADAGRRRHHRVLRAAGNLRPDVRAQPERVRRADPGRPDGEVLARHHAKRPRTAPSQLIVSARGTLEVGFAAAVIATAVALAIGVGGGFIGGISDDALNLLTNADPKSSRFCR